MALVASRMGRAAARRGASEISLRGGVFGRLQQELAARDTSKC